MALADLITSDVVKVPLDSRAKPDVIRELLQVLHDVGKIGDVDTVYDAVMMREAKCSTGLEQGIAVPHAKTEAVDSLTVAMGVAPNGVDFDSFDGQPARVFFLMLAPPDQSGPHIEALAETARIASSPSFVKALVNAGSAHDVVRLFNED
jgi:mannitol/fructose-specific phosphotransferase system IIA component (Ntr-type)